MREDILKAVAQPPKVLWAPMVPALINLGVQFVCIIIAHAVLVGLGFKEPHLSTMLQAYGQTYRKTANLYAVKGNKFEP